MAVRIVIDMFSGRPNPEVTVDGAAADELLARLAPGERLKREEQAPPPPSFLGYRGIVIEQLGEPRKPLPARFKVAGGQLHGPRLVHRSTDAFVEDFISGGSGPFRALPLEQSVLEPLREQIAHHREVGWPRFPDQVRWPARVVCRCAPLYEPAWWNDGGTRQLNNNCYNYATDYRTDTFAQPGLASGVDPMTGHGYACDGVRNAAVADALIDSPGANNRCPEEGHLVALMVSGWDYHWMRLGRNGRWTHKPGHTPVTNVDNSGHVITDPRTADRGPYTSFCTFMTVMHGHIKIR